MTTILAFLAFAQDAAHGAGHEETSKTPFYVVGGIAALYGFGIALFGMAKHDFPGSKGAVRGVCALSALVVAAAMASSVVTG
jgi:hypothetical protein